MLLPFSSGPRTRRCAAVLLLGASVASHALADSIPTVGGVVRARYELMTTDGQSRFAVRNARVWVRGQIRPRISYAVATDLCDQGKFQFLDAYGRFDLGHGVALQAGQFRIPFGVDPFRGPGNYVFADRSFIARDIDNIRAVGVQASYALRMGQEKPAVVTLGIFSPNAITDQNHWSKTLNQALKVEVPVGAFRLTGGWQSVRPDGVRVNMADACVAFAKGRWTAEAEYIYEHYAHDPFPDCHSYNAWLDYGMPLRKAVFDRLSFQARFDAATSHSGGTVTDGRLTEDHPERKRITVGSTLSYARRPVKCEFQLNYQKYFYKADYVASADGRNDKIVAEVIFVF